MPIIKLFEQWLNEAEPSTKQAAPTAQPATEAPAGEIISLKSLTAEAAGKPIGKPYASKTKGLIIVPTFSGGSGTGVGNAGTDYIHFNIYKLDATNPTALVTPHKAQAAVYEKTDGATVPPADKIRFEPESKVRYQEYVVGTVIDLYNQLKRDQDTTLTPQAYIQMLDSTTPGLKTAIAAASSDPNKKLIHMGTAKDPSNKDAAELLAAISGTSAQPQGQQPAQPKA